MPKDEAAVQLTYHEAALMHFALGTHGRNNGGRTGDTAHDEMIDAIESARRKLEEAFDTQFIVVA